MHKSRFNKEMIQHQWDMFRVKAETIWNEHREEIRKTAAGMVAACVICVGGAAVVQPNAYEVSYDGEMLGYVTSEAEVNEAIEELKAAVAEQTGIENVIVDKEALKVAQTKVRKSKTTFDDADTLKDKLLEKEAYECQAYNIVVDGTPILAASSEDEAEAILEGVKNTYATDGSKILSADYKEKVEIVQADAKTVQVAADVQSGINYIITGSAEPKAYTVQSGDTLWDVAHANGMTSAELIAANPGFDPNKLKIGQELNLVAMEPYMTVVVTEEVTVTESIPFTTEYKNNSSMAQGTTSIITAGKNGSKEVVSKQVSENGVVVASEKLSETVTAEPVVQTAYKGTKRVVYTASSGKKVGNLSNPLHSIQISSGYGASRGSRRHLGVDLRAPKGTSIYAVADGVVTKVSSTGSYGKLIVISHGNGITTKYAHCNSIDVSVGQNVSRGAKIGTVGSTGNATGNVLHYEVLVNGSNVNPANYLR